MFNTTDYVLWYYFQGSESDLNKNIEKIKLSGMEPTYRDILSTSLKKGAKYRITFRGNDFTQYNEAKRIMKELDNG